MPSRDRIKSLGSLNRGTSIYGVSNTVIETNSPGDMSLGTSRCVDVVDGSRNDHPLEIRHSTLDVVTPLNGKIGRRGSGAWHEFYDFVPSLFSPGTLVASVSIPSDASAATTAMARTNPNRPMVSLPVAIGELKDLPGLLKFIGKDLIGNKQITKNFHNNVGNSYLAGVYGIAPMVSDALKLLDFESQVRKRTGEIQRLYSKGGLKRRIQLQGGSGQTPKEKISCYGQGLVNLYVRRQTKTTVKRWATVRWLPTEPPPSSPGDADYAKQARAILLGLGRQSLSDHSFWSGKRADSDPWGALADAWELMPWSWLIDWFSNTGDYLAAKRNSIPVQVVSCNVMTNSVSITSYTRNDGYSGVSGGNASTTYETKRRFQTVVPSISADIPFLSGHQLSILGALGLQRLRVR